MKERAKEIAEKLLNSSKVHIVSHIDADGITAGSIAYAALTRAGINTSIQFVKQLEERILGKIKEQNYSMIWFADLGSGQLGSLDDLECVITDHHEPQGRSQGTFDRGNILSYSKKETLELNPHRYGIDGSTEISGAGTAYLVAREMGDNKDLSKLAIVGAVGDMQASGQGKLIGYNRKILAEAEEEGVVSTKIDAQLYGIESRPISKVIEYASDPLLPGLSGDTMGSMNFLEDLEIPLKQDGEWRRWYHLEKSEKRKIISALADRILDRGYPPSYASSLVGEIYTLPEEEHGTMLHEAKEFSTLLNSCGRYRKGNVALEVCLGDRGDKLKEAQSLLRGHQKVLVDCLQVVESQGVKEREYIQYFHGGHNIPETVLGTVAGMVLGSGKVDRSMPILGFAYTEEEDGVKVSSRATRTLVDAGLDLSMVMSKISKDLGGEGGGHAIAAGAFIPQDTEEEFIRLVESMVKKQMN